jgi:cytochrome c-type biogenesis protein CcmE
MSRKLLIGTLLAGAGALALVFTLGPPTRIYSMGVSEFVARRISDQPVRVVGTLVHGTLCKVDASCGYRFHLQGRPRWNADVAEPGLRTELSVRYDGCLVPDTFREVPGLDLEVVVEGEQCQGCHDFAASQIMTRSGGKYEMNPDGGPRVYPTSPMPRCRAHTPRM